MPRLLVIDDDAYVRDLVPKLAYNMAGRALEVVGASDVAEALAICRATPVDVVLTDYFMPDHDGPELVRRLQASFPRVRAVFMTGDAAIAGRVLPESDLPVGDKAQLGQVVHEAVQLALGGL